jgi:hypothetical protein
VGGRSDIRVLAPPAIGAPFLGPRRFHDRLSMSRPPFSAVRQ